MESYSQYWPDDSHERPRFKEIVKLLLERGGRDNFGSCASGILATAFRIGDRELINEVLPFASPEDKDMAFCSAAGRVEIALDFIHVWEVSAKCVALAFHEAVGSHEFRIAERMLAEGADINAKRDNTMPPETALESVIKSGNVASLDEKTKRKNLETIEFLVNHGADVNAKDGEGRTLADIATGEKVKAFLKSRMTPTAPSL